MTRAWTCCFPREARHAVLRNRAGDVGVSGRATSEALIAGQRDPAVLASYTGGTVGTTRVGQRARQDNQLGG